MTVRHDAAAYKAEGRAWRAYQESVHTDYREECMERSYKTGGVYVDPSEISREHGAAWLAAYRERELHCRRRKGA